MIETELFTEHKSHLEAVWVAGSSSDMSKIPTEPEPDRNTASGDRLGPCREVLLWHRINKVTKRKINKKYS